MENFNLKLAQIDNDLDQLLNGIPVGVAYFLLKTKISVLEQQYYTQVQKEYQAILAKQKQEQIQKEQTQNETES